jgi:putative iron-regulated protein
MKYLFLALFALISVKPAFADAYGFPKTPEGQTWSNELAYDVLANYAGIAFSVYADALEAAREFQIKVNVFAAEPSEAKLEAVREEWIRARSFYGMTEVFRFSEGPIDMLMLEEAINAWPIEASRIDYVEGQPDAGIINQSDAYPYVSGIEILKLNVDPDGGTNGLTGWHAIEFLLWGEDRFEDSAGQRPVSDFTTDENAERRMDYLRSATRLLNNHLYTVVEDWKGESYDNFLGIFLMDEPSVILKRTLRGMLVLSGEEMAEVRILKALDGGTEMDEQSGFSDTTHLDFLANLRGIQNLFEGHYMSLRGEVYKGPGFHELFASVDAENAGIMKAELAKAFQLVKELPTPFDQVIASDADDPRREPYLALAQSLKTFAEANRTIIEKMKL